MMRILCSKASFPVLLCLVAAAGIAQAQPQFSDVGTEMTISPTAGGTASSQVSVTAGTGVTWTITIQQIIPAGSNWLTISPSTGTGNATVTFTADAAKAPQGGNATVDIAQTGFAASDRVRVNLSVGGSGAASVLNSSPGAVVLNGSTGITQVQQILNITNVNGTTGTPFTVTTSTSSGGNWLSVSPLSGSTPAYLTVTGTQTGLGTATYQGYVYLTPNTGPQLQIPVTLNANGSSASTGFALTTNGLGFLWQTGTAQPSAQQVGILSTTGNALNWTATATSNGNWLRVAPSGSIATSTSASGVTGTNALTVAVDATGLTPNTYTGAIRVDVTGYPSQTINVTLTVTGTSTLTATTSSLAFSYIPGSTTLPPAQSFFVNSPTGAIVTYNVTSNASWLSVSPASGSTSSGFNQVTAQVNPSLLSAGTYTGNVIITPANSTASLSIPVTFTVGSGGSAVFNVSPSSLTFQSAIGGSNQSSTLQVTSLSGSLVQEQFLASVESTGGWLTIDQQFATTPRILTVTVAPSVLTTAGSYTGNIRLQSVTTGAIQLIPVSLVIGGGVTATPTSLAFTGNAGGTAPLAQTISLAGTAANFSASSNVNWLQVSPTSGTSPANITITPVITGLTAGSYNGTITVVAGGQTFSIPVTLTLGTAVEVNVSSTALTFNHQARPGASAPPAQTVRVTSPQGSVAFTAARATGGSWLTVSPASGTTPADISISVDPAGLAVGPYSGTVTVSGPGGASTRTITVTLNVTNPPAATVAAVTNGASLAPTAIAPGLIVSVWGLGFTGGNPPIFGQVTGGRLISQLGNTRLLFDGVAAPLLYVGDTQINAVVPYAVYGRVSTRVQVEVNGIRSDAVELRVVDAAPAIFSADQSGRGPGAILNENGTLNTAANPARRGSVITFWATGEGLVDPAASDGQIINSNDLRRPVNSVSVNFGGTPFQGGVPGIMEYSGSAPGFVSGSMQVNVRIPANAPTGNNVPLLLNAGSSSSPAAVTVSIQ